MATFKKGDKVRIISGCSRNQLGKIGVIGEVLCDNGGFGYRVKHAFGHIHPNGELFNHNNLEKFTGYETGDRVIVIGNSTHSCNKVGETGTVDFIGCRLRVIGDKTQQNHGNCTNALDIRPVVEPESCKPDRKPKFKVGDRVIVLNKGSSLCITGEKATITRVDEYTVHVFGDKSRRKNINCLAISRIKLIKEEPVGNRTFKLIKETDVLLPGALFQKTFVGYALVADYGDYDKFGNVSPELKRSTNSVENNPDWFEEVFELPKYVTAEELRKLRG